MMSRLLAAMLIVDGLVTAAWGRGFIAWQRRIAPGWYSPLLDALLGWPEPLLRAGAAGEALLGGLWLVCLARGRARQG
jgi:hypothetical protein